MLIYDLDYHALTEVLAQWNEPTYRAKQIWQGLYQHHYTAPDQFTNLPKPLRFDLFQGFLSCWIRADMFRVQRIPENAVRHHPAIGEVHIGTKLDRHHLVIHLHHNSLHPTANALTTLFMIAKNIDGVPHFIVVH